MERGSEFIRIFGGSQVLLAIRQMLHFSQVVSKGTVSPLEVTLGPFSCGSVVSKGAMTHQILRFLTPWAAATSWRTRIQRLRRAAGRSHSSHYKGQMTSSLSSICEVTFVL